MKTNLKTTMASLVPWKPFSDFNQFFDDEDWLLPIVSRTELTKPAMDVYETDKDIVAEVNIAGFDPEKVNVSVEDGILKISGKMDEKKETKKKGYWQQEIKKGSFERMIRLPVAVKENLAEATYEKGVLKIVIPKVKAKPKAKTVKIKVKKGK